MKVLSPDRRRAEKWLEKWKKKLRLEHYTLNLYFINQPHELAEDEDEDEVEVLASVQFLDDYLSAIVNIYPCFSKTTYDLAHKERTLLHELLHVAMRSRDELAVSHMTNVIWALR